jgi:hypothetical protein
VGEGNGVSTKASSARWAAAPWGPFCFATRAQGVGHSSVAALQAAGRDSSDYWAPVRASARSQHSLRYVARLTALGSSQRGA